MTNNEKNMNCLVDLTALYDSRKRHKKLDYAKLTAFLAMAAGVDSIKDFQSFQGFTVFSPKNQEQEDFVSNLTNLGWDVDTYNQYQIELLENIGMKPNDYRFNSLISLKIGSLVNDDPPSTVVVVSDSFDLYNVMEQAHREDNLLEFLVVYFKDHMDARWGNALNESKDFIRFHDLNEIYHLPAAKSDTDDIVVAI
jgi:hypothetical protein